MRIEVENIYDDEYFGKCLSCDNGLNLYTDPYQRKIVAKWENRECIRIELVENLLWPYKVINLRNMDVVRCRKIKGKRLLPKDKHNVEIIEELKNSKIIDVLEILPELFDWIGDPNWPISKPLSRYLVSLGEIVIPFINYIIKDNTIDIDDKMSVFYSMLPLLEKEKIIQLKEGLERIYYYPTEMEKEMNYDQEAKKYLEKIDYT